MTLPDLSVRVPLTKAERAYVVRGLRSLAGTFAQELADRIDRTRCTACRGSGYAPYVGGDDDEVMCLSCGGSGFDSVALDDIEAKQEEGTT